MKAVIVSSATAAAGSVVAVGAALGYVSLAFWGGVALFVAHSVYAAAVAPIIKCRLCGFRSTRDICESCQMWAEPY